MAVRNEKTGVSQKQGMRQPNSPIMALLSIVYLTYIYRISIVYLSCIYRISIVYLSYIYRVSIVFSPRIEGEKNRPTLSVSLLDILILFSCQSLFGGMSLFGDSEERHQAGDSSCGL